MLRISCEQNMLVHTQRLLVELLLFELALLKPQQQQSYIEMNLNWVYGQHVDLVWQQVDLVQQEDLVQQLDLVWQQLDLVWQLMALVWQLMALV